MCDSNRGCVCFSFLVWIYPKPNQTIPYHTIPYHTIPHHIISYHTIPYHTISYHTMCVATIKTRKRVRLHNLSQVARIVINTYTMHGPDADRC